MLLFLAVLVLVLSFGASDGLAHAYGFAVTGTMLMTSLLAFAVLPGKTTGLRRTVWLVLICGFLLMDVLLFSSNALKLFDGGWVPLLVGAALLTLMVTWKQGREKIHETPSGDRSDERRVGKEWVSKCRSRWSPSH